jgi:dTDP-4-dehydrorhamnose reductase
MKKPVILVTGADGQVGMEFRVLANRFPDFQFIFTGRSDLPIQDEEKVLQFFSVHQPAYCINCAAFTGVDKAETEKEMAFLVNATAVGVLASASKKFNTKLIHISTDYVFDGQSPVPYTEKDITHPVNTYGASKLRGEELCLQNDPDAIIIRTAWVYSAFGNNFVKTMLRLMKERASINVVNDQVGAPTYAADLAEVIMKIIEAGPWRAGIYHYSNSGKISWYDFARAIKDLSGSACQVNPISSSQYPTPASRPSFSLLDTTRIREIFKVEIPHWHTSLEKCLRLLLPH